MRQSGAVLPVSSAAQLAQPESCNLDVPSWKPGLSGVATCRFVFSPACGFKSHPTAILSAYEVLQGPEDPEDCTQRRALSASLVGGARQPWRGLLTASGQLRAGNAWRGNRQEVQAGRGQSRLLTPAATLAVGDTPSHVAGRRGRSCCNLQTVWTLLYESCMLAASPH